MCRCLDSERCGTCAGMPPSLTSIRSLTQGQVRRCRWTEERVPDNGEYRRELSARNRTSARVTNPTSEGRCPRVRVSKIDLDSETGRHAALRAILQMPDQGVLSCARIRKEIDLHREEGAFAGR